MGARGRDDGWKENEKRWVFGKMKKGASFGDGDGLPHQIWS